MPSLKKLLPALAAGMLAPSLLAAQVAPGEYAARRQALLARIDSGAVLAFGNVAPTTHWPPFSQLPSFLYLTGFNEPDAAVLMVKRGGTTTTQLFVPPNDLRMELFTGARVGPEGAQGSTGMMGRDLRQLRASVDSLVGAGLPLYTVSDVHTTDFARADSPPRGPRAGARRARPRPGFRATSLDTVVLRMRARKSPAEMALLRRAVTISGEGHLRAMRALEAGCNEGEIQALMEHAWRAAGAEQPGYGSIVGSGPNALKLHYDVNDRVARAGEMVVIDASTALQHYSADVTRTLPVSGRFTPDQRAIYQLVLDAQSAYTRQIRSGALLMTASDSGRKVIAEGLARLGLIESPDATFDPGEPCFRDFCEQVRLFAWHAYGGHGIGLEVHDPAQYYFGERRFAPGDVFTVEPGIYVSKERLAQLPDTPRNRQMLARIRAAVDRYAGIGVRIEDDYLVNDQGTLEWLSSNAPRDPDAVEAMMREAPAAHHGRCEVLSGR